MDLQTLFNIAVGLIGSLWAFLMKLAEDEIKSIKEEQKELPNIYARRDDVKTMKDEIITLLQRIEDKVERHYG